MPTNKSSKDQVQPATGLGEPATIKPGDECLGLTELLRAYLDRPGEAGEAGSSPWKHRLVVALLGKAEAGDLKALQEIWTRLEGRPGIAQREEPEPLVIDHELALRILRAAGDDDHADEAEDAAPDDEDAEEDDRGAG
jgi:hypothetical protein